MKKEIKILKICYLLFFIIVFYLFFSYSKSEKIEVKEPSYTYKVEDTAEEMNAVGYKVQIAEYYSDDILLEISNEILLEYCKIYKIENALDKTKDFYIYFYKDGKCYKKFHNNKIMEV